VLSNSGTAIMGSATASGANRAQVAINKALDSPLLNDNKIAGAKNVLLLIVSGTEEITIDEIGEISDHIQTQAGHGANIIMGVGDDETLDGAVSITVIATGFDAEQQNEITNTETKKIIHTLGDEAKAQLDLTPNITATHVVLPKQTQQSTTASLSVEAPVIMHTLFEEEEELEKGFEQIAVQEPDTLPFEGYIPTSEFLKNIDVDASLVDIHHLAEFEQLVINEINVNNFEVIPSNVIPHEPIVNEQVVEVKTPEFEENAEFVINDILEDLTPEVETQKEAMLMFEQPLNDHLLLYLQY